MIEKENIKLNITELFHFESGQTVFVGKVENGPVYIPACELYLIIDGNVRQKVRLEGEMIPDTKNEEGLRIVSSNDKINLTRAEVLEYRCYLQNE